jgi:hypothetical protein
LETAWLPMMLPHQIYHYLFEPLLFCSKWNVSMIWFCPYRSFIF